MVVLKINERFCLAKVRDKGIGIRKSYLTKKIFVKDDPSTIEFTLKGFSTKIVQEKRVGSIFNKKIGRIIK